MNRIASILAASFWMALICHADGARTARFMIWAPNQDLTTLFDLGPDDRFPDGLGLWLWLGGEETREIEVPFNTLSRPIPLPAGDAITLFQQSFSQDAADPTPPLAMRTSIAENQREVMVILVPQAALLDKQFYGFIFDDSQQHFPVNSARFINLSDQSVEVALGETRFQVDGRSQRIESVDLANGSLRLIVARAVSENSNRPRVASRNLRVYDGIRVTVFLYGQGDTGERLRLRIISEKVHERDNQ